MTSLVIILTIVRRRWRLLKHNGDRGETESGPGVQLDDLVKLLCYTGRRRRRRGPAGREAKLSNPGHADTGQQPVLLPDPSELIQLAVTSPRSVGGGLMQENERYSSASDINAGGTSTSLYLSSLRLDHLVLTTMVQITTILTPRSFLFCFSGLFFRAYYSRRQ